ncbi:SRPBCC family protein [Arthrobacter sp. RCC_34]|uniref:SRPBCC family protein n=1 Tax=Arthrobacter sp. RCC_34 TaxID=3239230 RepID=UPI0035269783
MARIHQDIEVSVPLWEAYEQWSRVELLPGFLRHLSSAVPLEDELVRFTTEIGGRSRQFIARVQDRRPDRMIRWSCAEDPTHHGEITFDELGHGRTQVDLTVVWEPARMSETSGSLFRLDEISVLEDLQEFKRSVEASHRNRRPLSRLIPGRSKTSTR